MDEQGQYDAPSTAGINAGTDIGYAVEKLALGRRHRQPTVREQVQERIVGLEHQLAQHKAVLAVLDEQPGVEKALDALRKIGV